MDYLIYSFALKKERIRESLTDAFGLIAYYLYT